MTVIVTHGWSDAETVADLSVDGRIEQASRAQAIAVVAHRGQVDKLGVAYIEHPMAVAFRFDLIDDTLACCAAWLHDVLEDTDLTADDLELAGIHPGVIEIVELLTRRAPGDAYYEAIARHPDARAVKLADIQHNTHPRRTRLLDPATRARLEAKYRHALRLLDAPWPDHALDDHIGGSWFGSRRLNEGDLA